MIDLVPKSGMIKLGKQGENRAIRIILPNIRAGSGSILLLHQRALDKKPYPVPVAETSEGIIWAVSATDTANQGRGQAELQWLGENGEIVKSIIYQTETSRSLSAPGAVPDEPMKPYVQAVARDAQAAKDAAASAKESARSAEASAGQAGLSADNAADSLKRLEDGIASGDFRGEKGDKGDPGPQGPQGEVGPAGDTTAADAAAEAAKKAAQEAQKAAEASAGSAAQAAESVGGLVDELESTQKDLAKMKRAIQFQAELNKGQTWDFEEDTQEAYQRQVPSGAVGCAVRKIGGKTVTWNTYASTDRASDHGVSFTMDEQGVITINRTANSSFFMISSYFPDRINMRHTYCLFLQILKNDDAIPIRFELLNRYGCNTPSIAAGRITKIYTVSESEAQKPRTHGFSGFPAGTVFNDVKVRAAIIDLTKLFGAGNEPANENDPRIAWIEQYAAARPVNNDDELVSAPVDEVLYNGASVGEIPEAVQSLPGYGTEGTAIQRTDTGWEYVRPDAEPVDITDLMADFPAALPVEAGGSITMHNAAEMPVPGEVEYVVKLQEAIANAE